MDTNVIREHRQQFKAKLGVQQFFQSTAAVGDGLYLSVMTIGELHRAVDGIRYRGDQRQAAYLEAWLQTMLDIYAEHLLEFTATEAQIWGRLRVPHPQNSIDKQLAATA